MRRNGGGQFACKGSGRERMVKTKQRCEGKRTEGAGRRPTMADVWPEK